MSKVLLSLLLLCAGIASCTDDPDASPYAAPEILDLAMNTSGANVLLSCKVSRTDNISSCGFYLGSDENDMRKYDSALPDSTGFGISLSGLTYGVKYYYRSFVSGGRGVRMSDIRTVEIERQAPTVNITSLRLEGETTVVCEYSVENNFSGEMIICGLCWGEEKEPTIQLDTKTLDGSDYGLHTVRVENLEVGRAYSFRAYAVNGKGLAYSGEVRMNIPLPIGDDAVRTYLLSVYDEDSDGGLSLAEASRIRKIDLISDDVTSLDCLKYFPHLDTLRCRGLSYGADGGSGRLSEVDLSLVPELTCLDLANNKFTSLDLSPLKNIRTLSLAGNSLIASDLFAVGLPLLTTLRSLDVSGCRTLDPDFALFTSLEELHYDENSGICRKTETVFRQRRDLRRLYTGKSLTETDKIYLLADLELLDCAGSRFLSINLSYNKRLASLNADGCLAPELDLCANPGIKELHCLGGGLRTLYLLEGQEIDGVNLNLQDHRYISPEVTIVCNPRIEDKGFNRFLLDHYDKNNDSYVSRGEVSGEESVSIDKNEYSDVASIYGIEMFASLKRLDVSGLPLLTELDLSKNTNLAELVCDNAHLRTVKWSGDRLKALYAQSTTLTSIELPSGVEDAYLSWSENLKSLDLRSCQKLRRLFCDNCAIETLDISHCSSMTHLDCTSAHLKTLYVAKGQLDCIQLVKDDRTQIVVL